VNYPVCRLCDGCPHVSARSMLVGYDIVSSRTPESCLPSPVVMHACTRPSRIIAPLAKRMPVVHLCPGLLAPEQVSTFAVVTNLSTGHSSCYRRCAPCDARSLKSRPFSFCWSSLEGWRLASRCANHLGHPLASRCANHRGPREACISHPVPEWLACMRKGDTQDRATASDTVFARMVRF
jgi:hypothetical protein